MDIGSKLLSAAAYVLTLPLVLPIWFSIALANEWQRRNSG